MAVIGRRGTFYLMYRCNVLDGMNTEMFDTRRKQLTLRVCLCLELNIIGQCTPGGWGGVLVLLIITTHSFQWDTCMQHIYSLEHPDPSPLSVLSADQLEWWEPTLSHHIPLNVSIYRMLHTICLTK